MPLWDSDSGEVRKWRWERCNKGPQVDLNWTLGFMVGVLTFKSQGQPPATGMFEGNLDKVLMLHRLPTRKPFLTVKHWAYSMVSLVYCPNLLHLQ